MKNPQDHPPATVSITPATLEEQPILSNLYQLYIHDFTDFVEAPLGKNGRFDYNPLPAYWAEPDRYPFLVWVGETLAGFALVKRGSNFSGRAQVWDMADFFIVRGLRRKGVGYSVAKFLWRQFSGPWEIRVIPANLPARHFWAKAIALFLGKPIQPGMATKGQETRYLFLFESEANQSEGPSQTIESPSLK